MDNKFTPQKIDLAAINEGNRYVLGEGIHPDAINRPIEASAYAQEIAESVKGLALNQPDSSQADIVGTPTVEISGTGETARFVFKSLKGERGLTGPSGVASGTVNSNAEGTSDTDGYTQQAVNKIASRPNLLINPDFSINQRGQTSYTGAGYSVDRWKGYQLTEMVCTPRDGYGVTLSAPTEATSTGGIYCQPFEASQLSKLAGRTVTVSFKVSANKGTSNIYVRTMANGNNVGDTPTITSGAAGIVSKTITLPSPLTSLEIVFRKGAGTLDVDIDWVKLEIGSVATAFIPPLKEEELWKCLNLTKSTAFPTSESQTSDTNILSEKAVYNNFVLNNKQQYLRDNYFAVTENGKYGMFFESGKLTEPWDSISMTFMLSDKNALNNAISTTIYELSYRANGTYECTVVLRRIAGDNQADDRLYVDYVNTGYSANSNYFRLYYLSAFAGDDSRMFTLLAYNQRFKASYFDYTTYSGNLTLLASISSIGTTTRFSTIVSSTYETPSNKTTSISSTSTDSQYPSAKAVYSYVNENLPSTNSWERFTEFSNNGFGLKFPEYATYTLMLFFNSTYYQFTIDIPSSSLNMAFGRYVGEAGGYKFYMDSDTSNNGYGRDVLIARDSNNAEVKLSNIFTTGTMPYYHKIRG